MTDRTPAKPKPPSGGLAVEPPLMRLNRRYEMTKTTRKPDSRTYYHVADSTYQAGDDLYCWDRLDAMGVAPEYKWEDYIDTEVVCLFDSLGDAVAFRADWLPGGKILRVDLPQWAIDERVVDLLTVAEGYAAVMDSIPAKYITEVAQ